MTENRTTSDAAVAASMAFEQPSTTLPHRRPLPAMTAEPSAAPPSINELEQACVSAFAEFVAARRRLTQAEMAHAAAVKARRP